MLIALFTVFSAASAHAQTPEDVATARSTATRGGEAFQAGRWEEALDLFSRAEQLHHALPHLLFMARANWKLGRLVAAHELYQKVKLERLPEGAPPAFVSAQQAAHSEVEQLAPLLARLTVTIEGAAGREVVVTIDGAPLPPAAVGIARFVDPGERRVEAMAGTARAAPTVVTLSEGEQSSVSLTLPAPPPSAPSSAEASLDENNAKNRLPAYVALGVGAVGLGAGVFFTVEHVQKQSDADDRYEGCLPQRCDAGVVDEIDALDSESATAGTLAWVGYGIGAAGIGAGLYLLVVTGSDEAATERNVTPWVGLGSAGLRGRF
jgi:hypothetical protein